MEKLDYTSEIELSYHINEELEQLTNPILLRALVRTIEEKLEKNHEYKG